jgi:hypothetical protein
VAVGSGAWIRRCFDDAVATQDTVAQLVAAMRKVARLVPGAGSVIERVARRDYSKPGKPDIDWGDGAGSGDLHRRSRGPAHSQVDVQP